MRRRDRYLIARPPSDGLSVVEDGYASVLDQSRHEEC